MSCTLNSENFNGKTAGDAYLDGEWKCRACHLLACQHPPPAPAPAPAPGGIGKIIVSCAFRRVDYTFAVMFVENADPNNTVVVAIKNILPRNLSIAGYDLRRADDVSPSRRSYCM